MGGGVETPLKRLYGERSRTVNSAKTALALFFILFSGSSLMKTYSQGLVQANGPDIVYTMRRFGVKMNNPVLPFEVNGSGRFYKNLFIDSLITAWHIQTQQLHAATAIITGDLSADKLFVTSTVLFNSLSGSGDGLVGVDTSGTLIRYNMTGNATDYFRGDGTFGNLSIATGWQLVGGTLLSTVNDVAIPGTLSVGHSINIGSFRFKNSALINEADTVITDRNIHIMTLADKIALEADTVTMREYTRVGSDTSKFAPPVTGKLALEVAGSATVIGDFAVKGAVGSNEVNTNTITANNMTVNTQFSSPRIVTSHIASPDSVIQFGDSTIFINSYLNSISTDKGLNPVLKGGTLFIQIQNPTQVPMSWLGNNTVLNPYMGNVGIGTGTSSPNEKLEIAGTRPSLRLGDYRAVDNWGTTMTEMSSIKFYHHYNTFIGAKIYTIKDFSSGSPSRSWGGTDLRFAVSNGSSILTDAMTINYFGNVGIGTTDPSSWGKLHVNGNVVIGSDLTATRITGPGNGGAIEIKSSIATTDRYLRLGRINNDQVFYPSLTIADNGNVGIGTTCPNSLYKLDVSGIIRSQEWLVENFTGCDYVFDKNYVRMHWKLKKEFCLKNNHLPNIDPASLSEKEGFRAAKNISGIIFNLEEDRLDITELFERMETVEKSNNEKDEEIEKLKKENREKDKKIDEFEKRIDNLEKNKK